MKKGILYLLMVVFATVGSSCEKLKDLATVKLNFNAGTITLDVATKATSATEVQLASEISTANLEALLKQANDKASLSKLKSLKIKSITATITNSDASNNFDNFSDLSATIASGTNTFIVSKSGSTTGSASTINFDVDSSKDLKTLLSGSGLSYTLKGKVKTATTKALTVTISATYEAEVEIL